MSGGGDITRYPRLNARNPRAMRAPVSSMEPAEADTPPGATPGERDR